ncbi:MAG: TolC family protein [Treponema sp.]|nr:TolC family protein [Treponema sp.]
MNKIFKSIFLAAVFLSGFFPVYAQDHRIDSLQINPQIAVDMAIRNNLNLESARAGLDIRRRRADYAWNQLVPSVTVAGNLSRENWAPVQQGMTIPIPGSPIVVPSTTLPQWRVNGAFSTSLDFSFALFEGMRAARHDYEAGLVSYDRAKLQMEQGVRKMYNSILLLQANRTLLSESLENTIRQATIAEANFRAGLAPRLTWLQAQVAVENLRPTVSDLDNNLSSLMGNFALLLGLPFDAVLELEPVFHGVMEIPADVATLISLAASRKPDIQELQASIIALHTQRRATNIQLFTPFLRLGWNISSLFNPQLDPFKDDLFTADNWNKGGSFTLTLGMSFNVFLPFTREAQQRRDMEANIEIQNIRLAQMIRETELEIFTKINSLERIRTTADVQRTAVNLAAESYRLTEEAYRAGLQDFQSVRSAALGLEQARLQLLTQQFNYLNDLIDLEYALGLPFGTLSSW